MATPSNHCAERDRDWTDLESPICDVRNMSVIVESLGNDLFKNRLENREDDGYAHISLSEDQLNAFAFAFSHMESLTRKLLDEFNSLFERSKEAQQ